MRKRKRGILDLPNELFDLIHEQLSTADLWSLLGVCRRWRQALTANSRLWSHFSDAIFKPNHRLRGLQHFQELSQGSFSSFTFIGSGELEHKAYAQVINALRDSSLRLRSLRLAGQYADRLPLASILNKEVLRHLDLDFARTGGDVVLPVIQQFPNIETLILRHSLRGSVRLLPLWMWGTLEEGCGRQNSLPSLRRLELSVSCQFLAAHLCEIQLGSLSEVAPSLEALCLDGFDLSSLAQYHLGLPAVTDLSEWSDLKTVEITNFTFHDLYFPILPPSLEKFRFIAATYTGEDAKEARSDIRVLPNLSNLKVFETNIDLMTVPSGSLWRDIILFSQPTPQLESLILEQSMCMKMAPRCSISRATMLRPLRVGEQDDRAYIMHDYDCRGFSFDLVAKLAEGGHLAKLQRLGFRGTIDRTLAQRLMRALATECPSLTEATWTGSPEAIYQAGEDMISRSEKTRWRNLSDCGSLFFFN